jgi:hypothetical protein
VFRRVYGIGLPTWDEPIPVAAAVLMPSPEKRLDVTSRALLYQRLADEAVSKIVGNPKITPYELLKLLDKAASTLSVIGKITGESQEISEARILRLPAWRRMKERMLEALRPYPEALKAVGQALKQIGGDEP